MGLYEMIVVENIDQMPDIRQAIHVAIGMFDGIHIGHLAVIEACLNTATNSGGSSAVLSFWPHPSKILRPEYAVPQIMPLESKLWTLERKGLDFAIIQSFETGFSQLEAADFVSFLKQHIPTLATLFVGENFRFGKGRKGDISTLEHHAMAAGVHVVSMKQCKFDGEVISSTRIRKLLQTQQFNDIRSLLGHPYTVIGATTPGRKIGRTIGFPTLNIDWSPELKPPFGVYAARLICHENRDISHKPIPGIANYGIRPTYDIGTDPVLEVHLFEPIQLNYGTNVAIELIEFIREERKFENQEALIRQIQLDLNHAKIILKIIDN